MSDFLSRAMPALREAAPDGFFVGGCVRDWLLGRPLKDLDVALPGRIEETGRRVARALGGDFFWLREAMQVGRIVERGGARLQIDLVPLAGSLDEDLRRRDFTVNAMAVSTREGLAPGAAVIDPTGGQGDLALRQLRLAAPDALEQDPLRCLRAFRLRTVLKLTFAPGLETAIQTAAPGLGRISGERIRDELFVLLGTELSPVVFADLLAHRLVSPWSLALARSASGEIESTAGGDRAGVLPLPSGLAVARALEGWLSDTLPGLACAEDLLATLDEAVTAPRSRRALLRLAALAIRAGDESRAIADALCLSSQETRVLTRAAGGAGALVASLPRTGSERLRFFQRWEPGAVEAVVLALAEASVDAPIETGGTAGLAAQFTVTDSLSGPLSDLLSRRLRPVAPLLSGLEVMQILGIEAGPAVGRWLQELEERRADGLIGTADEARAWLRERKGCVR